MTKRLLTGMSIWREWSEGDGDQDLYELINAGYDPKWLNFGVMSLGNLHTFLSLTSR